MNFAHNYLDYMPPKAIALTVVSMFTDWKLIYDQLGQLPPSTEETLDALSDFWDELCELVGSDKAKELVFHGPGMNQELYDELMELVE